MFAASFGDYKRNFYSEFCFCVITSKTDFPGNLSKSVFKKKYVTNVPIGFKIKQSLL